MTFQAACCKYTVCASTSGKYLFYAVPAVLEPISSLHFFQSPSGQPNAVNSMFQNDAITVQQTMRGCFQECLGCEAKSEYRVFPGHIEQGQARADNIPQIGHLLEESPCIIRCCCGMMRKFEMPLTEGVPVDGRPGLRILHYYKPWSFPVCCVINAGEHGRIIFPCCCFLPQIRTIGGNGQFLGRSQYVCDPSDGNCCCCVPMYHVFDSIGTLRYIGACAAVAMLVPKGES